MHQRSLISAFVIRLLESIISRLDTSEISIFWLVSVAEQSGLSLAMLETPKTGFLKTMPIWLSCHNLLIITRKEIRDAYAKFFDLAMIRLGGWGLLEMGLILEKYMSHGMRFPTM